jgi:hypothetical protein
MEDRYCGRARVTSANGSSRVEKTVWEVCFEMTGYWVTLIAGVWVALSPFFVAASSLKWSNVVFGIVIAALTYYGSASKLK